MQNSMIILGRNFPGFGLLGPYILTADEVADPRGLVLWLKVNGELRQHSDCCESVASQTRACHGIGQGGLDPFS